MLLRIAIIDGDDFLGCVQTGKVFLWFACGFKKPIDYWYDIKSSLAFNNLGHLRGILSATNL